MCQERGAVYKRSVLRICTSTLITNNVVTWSWLQNFDIPVFADIMTETLTQTKMLITLSHQSYCPYKLHNSSRCVHEGGCCLTIVIVLINSTQSSIRSNVSTYEPLLTPHPPTHLCKARMKCPIYIRTSSNCCHNIL